MPLPSRSIRLVDWRQDFVRALGRMAVERDPRSLVIIFPHQRPALYLKRFFATDPRVPRPRLLPEMRSFEDMVTHLRHGLDHTPLKPARKLDLAALLHEIALRLRRDHGGLLGELPLEQERFLPWGIRLAALLEEMLRQGITPQDIRHVEGEVIDWAAALLEHLSLFHTEYLKGLEQRDWTTPGRDAHLVMQRLDQALEAPSPLGLGDKDVVCAGFYALSGVEEAIFRRLWEQGRLDVFWHSDPALAQGGKAHSSTFEHRAWMRRWGAEVELFDAARAPHSEPQITFVEGFDLHSQLAALRKELELDPDAADTAVVLPDEGALLPVLHHLPENKEVNVSMGYPLERTALFQLMECVLRCREGQDEQGRYYWRDLLELVRHPYLKMLRAEDGTPLRAVLLWLEGTVRSGDPMQYPSQWLPPYGEALLSDLNGQEADLADKLRLELLDVCLDGFTTVETLGDMARAIQRLAETLLQAGSHLWKAYVTDAEYLARLLTSVIPQLMDTALSHEPLGFRTLSALFRQLCRAERVSFEAEPLTGLQVMGVLETRLLRFRRLFVLDAVEERLPGNAPVDPLLPDPLRPLLGLPDARERDHVSAYNFHRLVKGSERTVLLYQSGVQPGALEGKSVRSRYVEQLLWEEEQRRGELLAPGDKPPLTAVRFRSDPVCHGIATIPRSAFIQERLEQLVDEKGLTPSQLDGYLRCPKQFYYRYLTPLRSLPQVEEDGDRAEFGTVIHDTLRDFFLPYLNDQAGEVDPSTLPAEKLVQTFSASLEQSDFYPRMPLDAQRALLEAGALRLRQFLSKQKKTRILELEQTVRGCIELPNRSIVLHGRLDRVDRRDEGVLIMDYKTGLVSRPRRGFWDQTALWKRMEQPNPEDPALLTGIRDAVRGLQLPAYLRMYAEDRNEVPWNAAWIRLAKDGGEYTLFDKMPPEECVERIQTQCATLLEAVAVHLLNAPVFSPQEGTHCDFCDFRGPCGK